jgi:NAD-dependent deacetylase
VLTLHTSLWRRYDPTVYATIWGFDRAPNKIWELLQEFLAETTPLPNAGHTALAQLQALGVVAAIVTQNVGAGRVVRAA